MKITLTKLDAAIPLPVKQAADRIQKQGFTAHLAGGAVRDILLKRTPKDWDLVTAAPLEKLKSIFPEHLDVGVAYGILKLPPNDNIHIDVAMFRSEADYSDHRRPDYIEQGTLATDQARRDFTINALYLNLSTGEITDGVNGLKDLAAKRIRAVGKAEKRFAEDALRTLRAARFAAQLGFKIEPKTKTAMKNKGKLLSHISRERIREETWRALATVRAPLFLEAIMQANTWPLIFGTKPPKATLLKHLSQSAPRLGVPVEHWLTALSFCGYAYDLRTNLKLSNTEARVLNIALNFLNTVATSDAPTVEHLQPSEILAVESDYPGLYAFAAQRACTKKPAERTRITRALRRVKYLSLLPSQPKWPRAEALMAEGITPGPALGAALHQQAWTMFWKLPLR